MGKASRMKKDHRNAMADRPKWQAEASRQARERREEAVNQHNASFEEKMAKFNALSGDNDVVLIDNGVRYVGKEQVRSVYNSWVCNELERDDPSRLGAIAAMGPLMKTSIWDVKVLLIDQATGESHYENPLFAAFSLDKVNCFPWLLSHAVANPEVGDALIGEIVELVVQHRYQFDQLSARWTNAYLLLKTAFGFMDDDQLEEFVSKSNLMHGDADPVGGVANECLAKVRSELERKELDDIIPTGMAELSNVPNPHAIGPVGDAENDSVFDEMPQKQVASGAKRL